MIPLPKIGSVKINNNDAFKIDQVSKQPCDKNMPIDRDKQHDTKKIIAPPSDDNPNKCSDIIARLMALDE